MDFFSDIAKALQEQNFVPSINLILGAKYFFNAKKCSYYQNLSLLVGKRSFFCKKMLEHAYLHHIAPKKW